jgi:uncharacterized Fe-S cluster-containing MiaB family protein
MPAESAIDERLILASRGPKNPVDTQLPVAFFVEQEPTAPGPVEDVATILLANRECPFRCLFCDLWKNTTDERVPAGDIPRQIDYALAHLPPARNVKLYNSGNFFDHQAIPPEDYGDIARRVAHFLTVIVENHPKLCGQACVEFRDLLREGASARGIEHPVLSTEHSVLSSAQRSTGLLGGDDGLLPAPQLEIAMGLETVHPDILPRLNKQMTLDDFQRAAGFLSSHEIALRAFILLKPPFMREEECVEWAVRSLEFAFDCGVRVCSVIPTRSGNGVMNLLEQDGRFAPPRLAALEETLAKGIELARGRVFVDLWDIERLFDCPKCGPQRAARLRQMNLSQKILPAIECACT